MQLDAVPSESDRERSRMRPIHPIHLNGERRDQNG